MKEEHLPVLLQETIDNLHIKENGIYVDCTVGRAGHSLAILEKLTTGFLFCFDQDQTAISKVKDLFDQKKFKNYELINNNFINLESELLMRNIKAVDGIVYDLGVSSPQFDDPTRGFSYRYDARLDMRMNQASSIDAHYIINNYSYQQLTKIFKEYGEEQFANRIAWQVVESRKTKPINTTLELVDVIKSVLPQKILKKAKHPAKKIFQALRIAVNSELQNLELSLHQAIKLLKVNGYLAVITFHSLEDRITKQIFLNYAQPPLDPVVSKLPINIDVSSNYQIVTKKPIVPTERELNVNTRSKSAKLRVLKRVR